MNVSTVWGLLPFFLACNTEKPQDTASIDTNDTAEETIDDSGTTEPIDTGEEVEPESAE